MNKKNSLLISFIFCLVILINIGCSSTSGGSDSKTFHAGPFTMVLPADLKPVPTPASPDAYTGAFASPEIYLTFDYSMAANNFEDWPPSTEYELIQNGDKTARLGTVQRGFRPGYNFSTQIAFRDTGEKNLTVTAACKTLADCEHAKKIFRSIKFKPTTPE